MIGLPGLRVLCCIFLVITSAPACVSSDGPQGPSAKRVIVAPVNFDVITASQLEPGIPETDRLLQMFLRHRGLEVQRVPLARFTGLWNSATAGARVDTGSPEFTAAIQRLIAELAPGDPESVLVVPGIVYRIGEMRGSAAHWDGTSERIVIEGKRGDLSAMFNEPARGISIWIRVFDESGMIHEGFGGTELPWKVVIRMRGNYQYYYDGIAERDDLFRAPQKVARGITVAFDPYIPRQ